VSLASANATFGKLNNLLHQQITPKNLLALTEDELRNIGFSRQKIQYAPIMDSDRNPLTEFFNRNISSYPNKYEFDMNETVTTLRLNPIVESTMLTICANDGFDLDSRTFDDNDRYLNNIARINNYILLNQLELNKYKQQSAKILKNGIGISEYESGESIQTLNSALSVLNELNDRYIKLSKEG
jgi:hypothetical protein